MAKELNPLLRFKPTVYELRLLRLRRDYSAIRKKYFGNSIPEVNKVGFILASPTKEDSSEEYAGVFGGNMGCMQMWSGGIAVIVIDCTLCDAQYLLTLCHEMVHLKLGIKCGDTHHHGKRFQAEMQRLARRGAFAYLW